MPITQTDVLPVTGIYRELCLESVKNKYECEIQAACQHWEVRRANVVICFYSRILSV